MDTDQGTKYIGYEVVTKYNEGAESSVAVDFFMGLQLHHPIMSTLW